MANDDELGGVLCHEVGHLVARHSLKTLKKSREYDDIANSLGELTGVAGSIARDLGVALGKMGGALDADGAHAWKKNAKQIFWACVPCPVRALDPQGMITMFQKLLKIEERNSDLAGFVVLGPS